jgi:hypothetical protein
MALLTLNYYTEIDPATIDSALLDSLNKVVSSFQSGRCDFNRRFYRPDTTRSFALHRVSPKVLEELQLTKNDVPNAKEDSNILMLSETEVEVPGGKLCLMLPSGVQGFAVSGLMLYPRQGFMGWHTNSNYQGYGYRFYCTYVNDDHRSFFRYCHPETREVITSWDGPGWNFRLFRVDRKLLWHCVYSKTERYSIGFALKPRTPVETDRKPRRRIVASLKKGGSRTAAREKKSPSH